MGSFHNKPKFPSQSINITAQPSVDCCPPGAPQERLEFAPGILYFHYLMVGQAPVSQPFTITNTGDVPIGIESLTAPDKFTVSQPEITTLGVGESVTVDVTFHPDAFGFWSGDIVLTASTSAVLPCVHVVAIAGNDGIPSVAEIEAMNTQITNFGMTLDTSITNQNLLIDAINTDLIEINNRITQLETQFTNLDAATNTDLDAINNRLTLNETQATNTASDLSVLTDDVGLIETEITGINTDITTISNNLTALTTEVEGIAGDVDTLKLIGIPADGIDGQDARLITVSASHATVTFDASNNPLPQTTVFRVNRINMTAPITWRCYELNTLLIADTPVEMAALGFTEIGDTLSISHTDYAAILNAYDTDGIIVEAEVTEGVRTSSHEVSLVKIKHGKDGLNGQDGLDGTPGVNISSVLIYQRFPTVPLLPSVDTQYSFTDGNLVGLNNGWSLDIPAGTDPLYVSRAAVVSSNQIDTITANEWADPVILAADGSNGLNQATVVIYKRSATIPELPIDPVGYDFPTGLVSGLTNGWTVEVPSGTDPLYVTQASVISVGSNDIIEPDEWPVPVVLVQNGVDGTNGNSVAEITCYTRSATAPALPVGGSYNFANETLTVDAPWFAIPPVGILPLWAAKGTASSQDPNGTTAPSWLGVGQIASNGAMTDIVFKRSATQPATPAPSSGTPAGWYTEIIDIPVGSDPIWACFGGRAPDALNFIWQAPVRQEGVKGDKGDTGAAGVNSAPVLIYKRSASAPALPTTAGTYTFATGAITGLNNGWTVAVPANDGNPLYVSRAVASSNTVTDTIPASEWSAPVVALNNGAAGAAGLNQATLYVFQRKNVVPDVPGVACTYDFTTGVITGLINGWTQEIPAADGNPLYVTRASAISASSTDSVAASEWSTPVIQAQDGLDGDPGQDGVQAWHPIHTVGITRTGATFNKNDGTSAWNHGMYSREGYAGDVRVGWTADAANKFVAVGLNSDPTANHDITTIDFAIRLSTSGTAQVYLNGTPNGGTVTYVAGDNFAVERKGGEILFYKNNVEVFSRVSVSPLQTLFLDSSFYTPGASISGVTYTKVGNAGATGEGAWKIQVTPGMAVSGQTFTKTSGNTGWAHGFYGLDPRAGASISVKNVSSGGGVMFGLNSDVTSDAGYATIDYAIYFTSSGVVTIYENGVNIPSGLSDPTIGAHVWTVRHVGTTIEYCRNDTPFRTVTGVSATLQLAPDSSFYNTGDAISVVTPLVREITGGWTPVLSGMRQDGSSFIKTAAAVSWDASVRSAIPLLQACVSFKGTSAAVYGMIGLHGVNQDPAANDGYADLDYVWFLQNDGLAYPYSNGNAVPGVTGKVYNENTPFQVRHRADKIEFVADNVVHWTMNGPAATVPLYLDSSFVYVNQGVTNISFTSMGDKGTDAMTAELTNPAIVLPANSAGVVTSYAGATGFYKVKIGEEDVTADCTFSFATYAGGGYSPSVLVGNPIPSGANGGAYGITGGMDGVSVGHWELTATHTPTGRSVTKKISITKTKDGAQGDPGSSGATPKTSITVTNDTIPTTGTTETTVGTSAAFTIPAGGKILVRTAGMTGVVPSGNISIFTLRLKVAGTEIASALCTIGSDGSVDDTTKDWAGQLFTNPTSGSVTCTLTRSRAGPLNSGGAQYDLKLVVEHSA